MKPFTELRDTRKLDDTEKQRAVEADRTRRDTTAPLTRTDQEHLIAAESSAFHDTEWFVSGRVRFRRRVIVETRTIEVSLRREELVIETVDVVGSVEAGAIVDDGFRWRGTRPDGPGVAEPDAPEEIVVVLCREVPRVTVRSEPYETVTASVSMHDGEPRHQELRLDRHQVTDPDDAPAGDGFGEREQEIALHAQRPDAGPAERHRS